MPEGDDPLDVRRTVPSNDADREKAEWFPSGNRRAVEEMVETIPYWCRISLLLVLMSLFAASDWFRAGQKATKWKEYGFVVLSGMLGALVGLLNDLVTSSISPEYFVLGKGLDPGAGLALRAGLLGMKAGFSAGAIAAAVCLYVGTAGRTLPPLVYRGLFGMLWRPVASAATGAAILVIAFRQFDPFGFSSLLDDTLDGEQIARFLTVWWVHSGLYLGLLVSIVWIIVDIAQLRNRLDARQGGR